MLRFALVSESPLVPPVHLASMAVALEEGLTEAWRAWRPHLPLWSRDASPSVALWDDRPLPPWADGPLGRMVPVFLVDGESRSDSALAIHYHTGTRPAARVYVEQGSGLNTGRRSICESVSHEMLEVLVNPALLAWDEMPGQPGLLVAREICDPTQRTYDSRVTVDAGGGRWQLANFTLPAWHGLSNSAGVEGFDHVGELPAPGYVGPEGYAIVRDRNWRVRSVYGPGGFVRHGVLPGKPAGRSEVLRAHAAQQRIALHARRPWWRRMLGRLV